MSKTAAAALPAAKSEPSADPAINEVKKILADATPAIAPLLASQWKARESGVYFNTHEVVPNAGTPAEHLVAPAFWANISQRLRAGDTIIAFPRDGAWYAELLVWDAGMNWASVSFKGRAERPKFERVEGVASDFEIGRDPIDGVVIRRISTGARVKGNFANAEDARKWILDHQRTLRG